MTRDEACKKIDRLGDRLQEFPDLRAMLQTVAHLGDDENVSSMFALQVIAVGAGFCEGIHDTLLAAMRESKPSVALDWARRSMAAAQRGRKAMTPEHENGGAS